VGWLLGIARNCVYDAMLRPRTITLERDEVGDTGLEERVVSRLSLRQAVATLADRDRELLALRYGADLKPREIGELLELRTNAVEVALSRARARLAAALEHQEPKESDGSETLVDAPDRRL
jgi:RNA polymerase sigma factor (sigma-70 family)